MGRADDPWQLRGGNGERSVPLLADSAEPMAGEDNAHHISQGRLFPRRLIIILNVILSGKVVAIVTEPHQHVGPREKNAGLYFMVSGILQGPVVNRDGIAGFP